MIICYGRAPNTHSEIHEADGSILWRRAATAEGLRRLAGSAEGAGAPHRSEAEPKRGRTTAAIGTIADSPNI